MHQPRDMIYPTQNGESNDTTWTVFPNILQRKKASAFITSPFHNWSTLNTEKVNRNCTFERIYLHSDNSRCEVLCTHKVSLNRFYKGNKGGTWKWDLPKNRSPRKRAVDWKANYMAPSLSTNMNRLFSPFSHKRCSCILDFFVSLPCHYRRLGDLRWGHETVVADTDNGNREHSSQVPTMGTWDSCHGADARWKFRQNERNSCHWCWSSLCDSLTLLNWRFILFGSSIIRFIDI